jgi:hypothetical protein
MLFYCKQKAMGFLGSISSFSKKFLGHAQKAVSFIGKNLHHVTTGLKSVQDFVANPQVQKLGNDVGIPNSIFHRAGAVASTLNNAVGLLPTLAQNASGAYQAGMNSIPGSTRQSLADLYSQANSIA